MIAVIFEVWPAVGHKIEYLDFATKLRTDLEASEGFISVERFESLSEPGKILSLSFFENEEAVAAWRNRNEHRRAQKAGREGVFSDYRLRVAAIMRDYSMTERSQTPADSRLVHEREN